MIDNQPPIHEETVADLRAKIFAIDAARTVAEKELLALKNELATSRKRNSVRQSRKFNFLELFAVALVATLLGAVGTRRTISKTEDFRIQIPAHAPIVVQRGQEVVLGVAFFINGYPQLTPGSNANILAWARALKGCQNGKFTVRGSASSAKFPPGSKKNNVQLANQRADVVLELLHSNGVTGLGPDYVSNEHDLTVGRRLEDHPGVNRTLELEAVTRRADLKFEDFGDCSLTPDQMK
jgi:outer membrane protein OmpA-like peptidoglycan-associated protein